VTQAQEETKQYWAVTIEEAQRLYKSKVWDATAYLLAIIKTHGASGWKWAFRVKDFCQQWQIPERTFYRALSKLRSLQLVFWEAQDRVVVWWQDIHLSDSVEAQNLDTVCSPPTVAEPLSEMAASVSDAAETMPLMAEPLPDVTDPLPTMAEQKPETVNTQSVEESPRSSSSSSQLTYNSSSLEKPKKVVLSKKEKEDLRKECEYNLRSLRIDPDNDDVLWAFGQFPLETIRSAITYLKQQKRPTVEIFVDACKEGRKPQQWQSISKEEVNPITEEAEAVLGEAISKGIFKALIWSDLHSCHKAVFPTGLQLPWWEAIEYLQRGQS